MTSAQITLTVQHMPSALDTRRGVVRMHREVLTALGLHSWDAVELTGDKVSAAVAAPTEHDAVPFTVFADDITMANTGVTAGAQVRVTPCEIPAARSVMVSGSRLARASVPPHLLRLALVGKVVTAGDDVTLLPQDLAPDSETDAVTVRNRLSQLIGVTWTSELLTVTETDPAAPVAVGPSTVVHWCEKPEAAADAVRATPVHEAAIVLDEAAGTRDTPATPEAPEAPEKGRAEVTNPEEAPPPAITDLAGATAAARTLAEWFDLTFHRSDLLAQLGTTKRLGVLLSGPEGVGKETLVRAVSRSEHIALIRVEAPTLAVLEPDAVLDRINTAIEEACSDPSGGVLLITDIEVLLPATSPPPVATMILDRLRQASHQQDLALVATTAHPESVDPRLQTVDLLDRELSLDLPVVQTRGELLRILFRDTPVSDDVDFDTVAEHTPGFVAADLAALRRDAALRAAIRYRDSESVPCIDQQDLSAAVQSVRPTSMSRSDVLTIGELTLDDVGDMAESKQALTETVLWPVRYPESFSRLGVTPPRGVLLYGPPGNGKTFLVRALAGSGALNVFPIKGAELMDKWVGESERAVRELFRRASEAAPSVIFLDELDALAPPRGQSSNSGVSDRIVAALLTEMDGLEALHRVVVLGATNRPELVDPALLRPGRLERLIHAPAPDAEARVEILRTATKNTPLASNVDLRELASTLDGYSAADCVGLIREAALTAMRESREATEVTAAHVATAREAVRPSLDPTQLASLEAFAADRQGD